MKNSIFKSIIAILAGFATGAILSIGTDFILEQEGMMKTKPFSDNPWWLIVMVVFYRTVYNVTGCYVAARLAPSRPMLHAMLIGYIGLALGIAGAIVMWDVPPHWYPIALIGLTLPSAWLGGKFVEQNKLATTSSN